jgi:hypothetical protein
MNWVHVLTPYFPNNHSDIFLYVLMSSEFKLNPAYIKFRFHKSLTTEPWRYNHKIWYVGSRFITVQFSFNTDTNPLSSWQWRWVIALGEASLGPLTGRSSLRCIRKTIVSSLIVLPFVPSPPRSLHVCRFVCFLAELTSSWNCCEIRKALLFCQEHAL